MPTVLPFHRAVVTDPAFTAEPLGVHTRWIETEFATEMPPQQAAEAGAAPAERETITVEVGGKRLEVVIPATLTAGQAPAGGPRGGQGGSSPRDKTSSPRNRGGQGGSSPRGKGGSTLTSPMQGTIVKIAVTEGQHVPAGEVIVVLEAMKMEQPLTAHKDGTVTGLSVEVGQTVTAGAAICELED
jgi:acetyl-CoA/propionyl-CoA carboxylase biotin carboxyl carrier protein